MLTPAVFQTAARRSVSRGNGIHSTDSWLRDHRNVGRRLATSSRHHYAQPLKMKASERQTSKKASDAR
jgi:uncharacterized protein (UPF0303 family)